MTNLTTELYDLMEKTLGEIDRCRHCCIDCIEDLLAAYHAKEAEIRERL